MRNQIPNLNRKPETQYSQSGALVAFGFSLVATVFPHNCGNPRSALEKDAQPIAEQCIYKAQIENENPKPQAP